MEWHDLFVATAGAAAALTGLIFVGISINLQKILSHPTLVTRASLSLILLMAILIFSVLLLIPGGRAAIGWVFTFLACTLWIVVLRSDITIYRKSERQYRGQFLFVIVLDQVCTVLYVIGGICLLASGDAGPYWIAAAFLFSFGKSVLDAWVLLIEIMR
jgi:hypothetical protein